MKTIFKHFSVVLLITIIIKGVDLVKNLLVASKLGVSNESDVYLSLISIPDSIIVLVGIDTIRGVVNSEYSTMYAKNQIDSINTSFLNLLKLLFFVTLILTVALILLREQVVKLFVPGFTGQKYSIAVELSLFIFPVFLVKTLIGLFQAALYSQKRFYIPNISQVFISLTIVLFIVFPVISGFELTNISVAYLAGNILALLFLAYFVRELFRKFPELGFGIDSTTKKILKSCTGIIALVFANQLFNSSKNFFASFYGEGYVSSLSYGNAIPSLITGLVFNSVFSVLLSNLSTSFITDKIENTKKIFFNTLIPIFFFMLPFIIILMLFGKEVLQIFYERGNFNIEGIDKTYVVLSWETICLIFWSLQVIPLALYLAKKDYKQLAIKGVSTYLFGLILNYVLTYFFGFIGILISTLAVNIIYAFQLGYGIKNIFGNYTEELIKLFKIFLIGCIIGTMLYFSKIYLHIFNFSKEHNLIIITVYFLLVNLFLFSFSSFLKLNYYKKIFSMIGNKK